MLKGFFKFILYTVLVLLAIFLILFGINLFKAWKANKAQR